MDFKKLMKMTLFTLALLSLMVACSSAPDSSRVGVFVETQSGLQEVATYGAWYNEYYFGLPPGATPPPFGVVKRVYVNLPGAEVVSARLLWISTLANKWQGLVRIDGAEPLSLSTRAIKDNLYELSAASLAGRRTGYLLLSIKMPLGTPERIYVIQIA